MKNYVAYLRNVWAALRGREPEVILMPDDGTSFYLGLSGSGAVRKVAVTRWMVNSNGELSIDLAVARGSSRL